MDSKTTLRDAILYFADFEHCRRFMIELRWPDGVVKCPHCGSDHVTWLANARVWKCYANHPMPRFSLKTGTIFEDSPLPLEKWLPTAWLIINCKNGISSYEVHRGLGVTQKTAWFMLHRIRLAIQNGDFSKLSGEVEADETYIGGKAYNMNNTRHRKTIFGTGWKGKEIVMGLLERKGKVRLKHIYNAKKKTVQGEIRQHVEKGSQVFTDALKSYNGLNQDC
jgi:transposase-like protein